MSGVIRILVVAGLLNPGSGGGLRAFSNRILTIQEVREDKDGDFVPDRLGDTVIVAGRANIASGILHTEQLQVFLQNNTAGLSCFKGQIDHPVSAGDSLIARGIVTHFYRMTQLSLLDYTVVPGEPRLFDPVNLFYESDPLERFEGMLVEMKGYITEIHQHAEGHQSFVIHSSDVSQEHIRVFMHARHGAKFDFSKFSEGDILNFKGILGQHDYAPPHDDTYEILLGSRDDLSPAGFRRVYLRRLLLLVGLALLVVGAWIILLQVEVKRQNRLLSEQKAQYKTIVEAAHDIIWIVDTRGRVIFQNRRTLKMPGLGDSDRSGDQQLSGVHPDDRTRTESMLAEVLKGEKCEFEMRVLDDDHREHTLLVNAVPYRRQDKIEGVLAFGNEISARKAAETALRNSEQRYRTIVNNAFDAIFLMLGQKYVYVNPRFTDITGYTADEVTAPDFDLNVFFPEDSRQLIRERRHRRHKKQPVSNQYLIDILHKSGKRLTVEVSTVPLRGEEQGLRLGVMRDITDRLEAEQALELEKVYFEELFNNAPESIALVDNTGIIQRINKEFTGLFGYTVREAVGRNIDELLTDSQLREEAQGLTHSIVAGKNVKLESTRYHKDGTPVPVSILGAPIRFGEGQLAVYAIYRDISARKQAELELRRSEEKFRRLSEELQESNNIKELLLDIITHDLANPVGVIHGMTEIMSEERPDDENLQLVKQSSSHLVSTLDNMTTLARISLGEQVEKIQLDLSQLIQDILAVYKRRLAAAGIVLESTVQPGILINANPIISEVISNYINNAIKYAKSGKRLVVATSAGKDHILVEVRDFGETIPREKQRQVFERGVQIKSGKKQGRGLGLAIVKRIAMAHDAEVGVLPNNPRGNIFYIRIPAA